MACLFKSSRILALRSASSLYLATDFALRAKKNPEPTLPKIFTAATKAVIIPLLVALMPISAVMVGKNPITEIHCAEYKQKQKAMSQGPLLLKVKRRRAPQCKETKPSAWEVMPGGTLMNNM